MTNLTKLTLSAITMMLVTLSAWAAGGKVESPKHMLSLSIADGRMTISAKNAKNVAEIGLGLTTSSKDFSNGLTLKSISAAKDVNEDYTMITGKRSHCINHGREATATFLNAKGEQLLVIVKVFDDGISFKYEVPEMSAGEKITADNTSYSVPEASPRWMQVYDRQGYENFYPKNTNGINPDKPEDHSWGFPALLQVGQQQGKECFMLLTESDVRHGHCGSWLTNSTEKPDTYTQQLADNIRTNNTPWRVMIIGSLADIVESTLVTDVATPSVLSDVSWIEPGVSSWIYWAQNHGSQDYKELAKYVDLARDMGWKYTLIDAEWDRMANGGSLEDIVKYANDHDVKPLLWYNSSTNWTGEWAPSPQYLLNKPNDRQREYTKAEDLGIAGLKIDFFPGDKQETMDYYLNLLEDAAPHHLAINFHGATIPRGWQRTYPHLMSMEAVYGAEWYNNNGVLTNRAACHNATLPFTRNVIGSMDYTPGTFTDSQHPHITTHAHELALTVLFESGIQHMPDRPEAYASLPVDVRHTLSSLPSAWDDSRLLAGYPGDHAVIARRCGDAWYIAGINGTDQKRDITISLQRLNIAEKSALLIADGAQQKDLNINKIDLNGKPITVSCQARGGFLIVVKPAVDRNTKYFTKAEGKATTDAEGFIRRWTVLEPISKPNHTNIVFTDTYLNDVFAHEYFKGQATCMPKDGEKVKAEFEKMEMPKDFRRFDYSQAKITKGTETLAWHKIDSRNYNIKLMRFGEQFRQRLYGVIYWMVTVVRCEEDMPNVRLAVGSNAASKWWLNGEEALLMSGDRRMVVDDAMSKRITLKKGVNILRGAVINGPGMSDFCLRFVDENGKPITNLTIE